MTTRSTLTGVLTTLAFCASTAAWAHYPTMDCQKQADGLRCQVGYSDGSSASGETVRLYSYDDELLHSLPADNRSQVNFPLVDGEFYISFNPGHDQPAEVDYIELE